MDRSKRKLRSGKETSKEERRENKDGQTLPENTDADDDSGCKSTENEGTPDGCERTLTHSAGCSEENNGRVCRECGFVAKTPTALKIHWRRKHNNTHAEAACATSAEDTQPAENAADETPPTDRLNTMAPPTGRLSAAAQRFERLYCRCCGFYTCTAEEMNAHLSDESHQKLALEKNIGPLFEQCVEKVLVILSDEQKGADERSEHEGVNEGVNEGVSEGVHETESSEHTLAELAEVSVSHKRKRGRPKSSQVTSCSHCGLIASNPTNLSVHIRRKHSRMYSFLCKLCNYSCVTKGDMDRHCETKKHIKRVQSDGDGQDAVVSLNDEQAARCEGGETTEKAQNATNTAEQETPNVEEEGEMEGTGSDIPCKKTKYDSVNSCDHCDFVAHSALSLALHVRRKHTRDFEFVCLACSYYAVTCREMSRHTATEKHKHKRKSYLQKRHNTHQHGESTDQHGENIDQQDEKTHTLNESMDEQDENVHQHDESADQHIDQQDEKTHTLNESTDEQDENAHQHDESTDQHIDQQDEKTHQQNESTDEQDENAHQHDESTDQHIDHQDEKTHQQAKSTDQQGKNVHQHDESMNQQGENAHQYDENSHQNADNTHQHANNTHVENTHQHADNPDQHDNNTHQHADSESGCDGNGSLNNDAGKGSAGEEEPNINTQLKLSENTNGTKHSLELPDPSHAVVTNSEEDEEEYNDEEYNDEEYNDEDDNDEDDNDEDDDDDDEEDACETTAESPSSERRVFRAAPFDECVFPLKARTDRRREGDDEETSKSLNHTAKMLRLSEGHEQEVNARVRCDDCGFLAEGLGGLNVHITMKHSSKEKCFHCLLCGKSFHSDSSLQQHLSSSAHLRTERSSMDERPDGGAAFRCVRCNEPCDSEQELFVHIKEKHEELLREVNKYVIEDTEQINREREENPGNVCKYCGKVCKSSNSMAFLAHVRTHTGSKPFMCTICNFATAQLGDARNHVKRHLGMREYKCHLCGWAFVMKKHLNTHLLGKHGLGQPKERKYDCEVCERNFSEKWALNNHMKLHTGEKPFKCPWASCHYAFLTHSAMKDHYRTHTGEKSFLCDLCGFAGGTRHALTKHRRQHTGERPFRCDLCGFASTTQSHLTRHKRVHTGEKPYHCPWCDYRSNCAENIRKHILHTGKHEGVMMYNCPRCDFCTNAPSEFRNHLKDKHRDIENPDLAYLHAGIVSKSFECRLKGQGSSYVETEAPFTPEEGLLGAETLQQVIIIQGYGEEGELQGADMEEADLEESAAATLQTLAMSSVNAELLQVTQDGRVIPYTHKNYVLVESSGLVAEQTLQRAEQTPHEPDQEGSGPSTALDALLCAVSEIDQQGGAAQQDSRTTADQQGHAQEEGQEAVQVYGEVVQVLGHAHEEVLQFAASQLMMREGLTQVIVNDEGTHYIVTEVADATVYAQSEGAESEQAIGLVDDTRNQSSEATVTYEPISLNQDAQE